MTGPEETAAASQERRRHARYSVRVPVRIFVLLEEVTFSPFEYEGHFINLSRSGALVILRDCLRDDYGRMIQRRRFVRVSCRLPGTDQPVTLFGKLIWYDFQDEAIGSVCRLAMTFEPMKEEIGEALDRYLELQKKETGVGLPVVGAAAVAGTDAA